MSLITCERTGDGVLLTIDGIAVHFPNRMDAAAAGIALMKAAHMPDPLDDQLRALTPEAGSDG